VAADPGGADARFDLALISDRRSTSPENDADARSRFTEAARQGYLAVLEANPRHLKARYNMVYLTWRIGAREDAQYHLQKPREISPPGDRSADSLAITIAQPPPAPSN
jgi:hypothetical protein